MTKQIKKITLYNVSACKVEVAVVVQCAKCRGVGHVSCEDTLCSRCGGHGRHWKTPGGWCAKLYRRKSGFLI